MRSVLPILAVVSAIFVIWYLAVAPMNIRTALDQAERSGAEVEPATSVARRGTSVWVLMSKNASYIAAGYSLKRPRLPTPAQVGSEVWGTTGKMVLRGRAFAKQSLILHGWITLKSTLWGFLLGVLLGVACAIAITYSRVMKMSLMPWAIISQTIPIVALAPMIIVLSSKLGIEERAVPKAIIAAYLCYFPVLVGMIKGLNSPNLSQLDLLQTYSANRLQSFLKLRLPASVPYLFTSLKVGIAAALVGTIVGELPTGAVSGLGARILIGDQFGTPMMIWAALVTAAIMAGLLVSLLDFAQKSVLRRMGMRA